MPRSSPHSHRLRPVPSPAEHPAAATNTIDDRIALAARGQMDAWGQLYREFFPHVYRHVRFLAGSDSQTEDLVQEVFARALVGLSKFDRRSTFSTWLHGIAINVVRNHWRGQKSTATAHERLRQIHVVRGDDQDEGVERTHLCRRRAEVVYALLADLPDHLREAFILRDLEGFTPAEAAAQLGISAGNVSVRASRARERIRKELEKLGWLNKRRPQT